MMSLSFTAVSVLALLAPAAVAARALPVEFDFGIAEAATLEAVDGQDSGADSVTGCGRAR